MLILKDIKMSSATACQRWTRTWMEHAENQGLKNMKGFTCLCFLPCCRLGSCQKKTSTTHEPECRLGTQYLFDSKAGTLQSAKHPASLPAQRQRHCSRKPSTTPLSTTLFSNTSLYNPPLPLQHSSPTLLSNTLFHNIFPRLLSNTSLQDSSPTILYNSWSNTCLQHSSPKNSLQPFSPTLLYNASLEHSFCNKISLKQIIEI